MVMNVIIHLLIQILARPLFFLLTLFFLLLSIPGYSLFQFCKYGLLFFCAFCRVEELDVWRNYIPRNWVVMLYPNYHSNSLCGINQMIVSPLRHSICFGRVIVSLIYEFPVIGYFAMHWIKSVWTLPPCCAPPLVRE